MSITAIPRDTFAKYTVPTGAGNYNLPERDVDALYGPGWPVSPVTRPEDSNLPRTIDYPVAINATLQPRIGYAGLMPIAALKAAYSNITEVSLPVNLIIRELSAFTPILRDKSTKQRVEDEHPFNWMTVSPDRVSPFNVWLTRFKKSSIIYAAPAFYKKKDHGKIVAMEYIDGSTLFLITNQRGDLPEPNEVDPELMRFVEQAKKGGNMLYGPKDYSSRLLGKSIEGGAGIPIYARDYVKNGRELLKQDKPLPTSTPAFTQIIKGIPFSFWDKSQVYFMPEPPSSSVDSPYGEVFIERGWIWINIIAVLTAFELGHYRTGNMPEGFAAMPKDWFPSMAKLAQAEREFNARMSESSQVQHARIRFGPENMKFIPTKKPDFPDKLYSQARDNIILSIGIPASEIGQIPGRGLGGKGFESGENQKVSRQILAAQKSALESAFNKILLESDVDDVEFYMDYPQEEIDPTIQANNLWNGFIHGINTLNDVLTAQDKEPIGKEDDEENIANMHLIIAGQSIYVVEKMHPDESGMIAPAQASANTPGGSPIGEEDAALQDKGAQHGTGDRKAAQQAAKNIERNGGKKVSTKFISIPELAKEEPNPSVAPAGVDLDEWRMGLEEEQEHATTVGNDQNVIADIVMDHIREDPKYYTHLKQVHATHGEKFLKRYKVVGNDVINIDTGEIVPGGHHDTKEEAEAHARALYANVPDAKTGPQKVEALKVDWVDYFKHCGVCPEDEIYFGAPIAREFKIELPTEHEHANEVEIVAMCPPGLPSQPALWKPEGGESPSVNENIGGPQYVREEAAWLLDQCLGFHMVPLAYVAESNGEQGAAIWYTAGNTKVKEPGEYGPEWVERAAVLDYIMSQQDRHNHHNYLTHPDDPARIVLIDNGFSFPANTDLYCESVFCSAMIDKPLSEETIASIKLCLGDEPMWRDILDVLADGGGMENAKAAVAKARVCAQRLVDEGKITAEVHKGWVTINGHHILINDEGAGPHQK
jgi:hypothetical protein